MIRPLPILALVALIAGGGCAPSADGDATNAAQPSETPALPPTPEMGAISGADIAAELTPGAGCSLVRDGKNLLVAVDGDAIAKPNGATLHFDFEGGLVELREGGAFSGNRIAITVTPADIEGQRIEELLVRPARVAVVHENGARDAFDAEWQCGA